MSRTVVQLDHVLISPETYDRLMGRMDGARGHTRECQKAGGVSFDGSRCICGIYRVLQELKHAPRVHPRSVDYVQEVGQGIATLLPDHEANQKKETR